MADTFAGPRDTDSLAVVIDQIGRLDRREGAREIIRRIALRAGVELDPTACWLLAKLSEDASVSLQVLAERASVGMATLTAARDELLNQGLILLRPGSGEGSVTEDGSIPGATSDRGASSDRGATYEVTAAGHATQDRLRSTGERRLADLLECWQPDQHPDLARFIDRLAREFFVDDSALRGRIQAPTPAGAAS
jgi:hypothetical protein